MIFFPPKLGIAVRNTLLIQRIDNSSQHILLNSHQLPTKPYCTVSGKERGTNSTLEALASHSQRGSKEINMQIQIVLGATRNG